MDDFAMEFDKRRSALLQDHSRHEGEAEFFASCGCQACYRIVGDDEAEKTLTAFEVLSAIRDVCDLPVAVDQTGGGTATIHVGYLGPDGHATLAFGPGKYDWKYPDLSTFYIEDITIGWDDDGEDQEFQEVKTLDDIRAAVPKLLIRMDTRFKQVLK